MSAAEDVDVRAILAQLGLLDPGPLARVAGGWDTAIWRVGTVQGTYALRVFRAQQLTQSQREVAVMQLAADAALPVPRVHGQTVWQDRPAMLMAWCPGKPLLSDVQSRPWLTWRLGVAMGRMQARIHAVRVPPSLADDLRPWLPRAGASERALQDRVAQAASSQMTLLHLDYHPLNVMTAGRSISGVLDWANAAAGDPRADIARTASLLRLAPMPPGSPRLLVSVARGILEAAWRAGYQHVAGPLSNMAPFYAWAGAMMEADLAPKLGRAGVWLQPGDLARVRRWTTTWKHKARESNGHLR